MRNYQLVLVLRNSLNEASRKKILDTVKSWIKGAKFEKEEEWGEKPLSYAIKGQDSAFFVNYLFETKDNIEKDFEKRLLAQDEVVRHLLLRGK